MHDLDYFSEYIHKHIWKEFSTYIYQNELIVST